MCKQFGVFANILLENVPLKMPFNWQSLNEHLEMIFPGLGNRIRMTDDSVLEVSSDSPTTNEMHNRSTPYTCRNHNGSTTVRAGSAKKSAYFPLSHQESDDVPEKRHKFDSENTFLLTSHSDAPIAVICKEKLSKCMDTFSGVFDHVFDLNVKLENKLKHLEANHEFEVKKLEQQNEYLAGQIEKINQDMKNELDLMEKSYQLKEITFEREHNQSMRKLSQENAKQLAQKVRHELKALEIKHKHEIVQLRAEYERKIDNLDAELARSIMDNYNLIERKNDERDQAVMEARKQCDQRYGPLIEDAKGKKYCIACGVGKPLDLFYVCDAECQKRYWYG